MKATSASVKANERAENEENRRKKRRQPPEAMFVMRGGAIG